MNNLIDSHVNFGHELLKNSVSDICKEALENNIERILSINSNIFEFQKDINLIKENLISQLTSPVLWTQTINNMISGGVDLFIECGPGRVLQGLVKKINRKISTESI